MPGLSKLMVNPLNSPSGIQQDRSHLDQSQDHITDQLQQLLLFMILQSIKAFLQFRRDSFHSI